MKRKIMSMLALSSALLLSGCVEPETVYVDVLVDNPQVVKELEEANKVIDEKTAIISELNSELNILKRDVCFRYDCVVINPMNKQKLNWTLYTLPNINNIWTGYNEELNWSYPVNANQFDLVDNIYMDKYSGVSDNLALMKAMYNTDANLLSWEQKDLSVVLNLITPPKENFALVITGYIVPEENGRYVFSLSGDDTFDFFLDNKLLISHYGRQFLQSDGTNTASVDLVKGVAYPIQIRVYDIGYGNAGLRFKWQRPSTLDNNWYIYYNELYSSIDAYPDPFVIQKD
jgi:hypothetical protein